MGHYLGPTGLGYLWGKIKDYAKIVITSGTTKVVIGDNEVTIPSGISPYTSNPAMNGNASAGSSDLFSRGDHVHPTDTSRAAASTAVTGVAYDTTNNKITKTINGSTTDVVTAASIVSGGGGVLSSSVGVASGVCPLDSSGKVPSDKLPGYVDDVVEAYPIDGATELSQGWLSLTAGGSALSPETGKIYVLLAASTNYAVNTEFRWGGSTYVQLNDSGCSEMSTDEMDTATNNWA